MILCDMISYSGSPSYFLYLVSHFSYSSPVIIITTKRSLNSTIKHTVTFMYILFIYVVLYIYQICHVYSAPYLSYIYNMSKIYYIYDMSYLYYTYYMYYMYYIS
jgi:hypothetical protein